MARRSIPRTLAAYRLEVTGEEIVLFVWESERPSREHAPLSAAEEAVLALLLEGRTNRAIAAARSTSIRTVANQVAGILQKLGAGSRYELLGRYGARSSEPKVTRPRRSSRGAPLPRRPRPG